MFTGIIESLGKVTEVKPKQENLVFTIASPFSGELKIDQSVAHNGVCLTVIKATADYYQVEAIPETLAKSNIGQLKTGSLINLERCMSLNGRLDGHVVQGHVDQIAICIKITDLNGSWKFEFKYERKPDMITVEKGSICVNGVSLTVVDSGYNTFSVAVIPYTFENTNFQFLKVGDTVNLEFDIIGKYISKLFKEQSLKNS